MHLILNLLLALVDAVNADECTSLHISAREGYLEACTCLLDFGASTEKVCPETNVFKTRQTIAKYHLFSTIRPATPPLYSRQNEVTWMLFVSYLNAIVIWTPETWKVARRSWKVHMHRKTVWKLLMSSFGEVILIAPKTYYGNSLSGCHVNVMDVHGYTALSETVTQSDDVTKVRALLAGGADAEAQDTSGKTSLHIATLLGHVESVGELIGARCSLDLRVNSYCS